MIRTLLLLFVTTALSAEGLASLVQPDGSATPVGIVSDASELTYTFPPGSVPERSWLVLPIGSYFNAELVTAERKTVRPFSTVSVPGLRVAVEVPRGLLSLTLKGTAQGTRLKRTLEPASAPWLLQGENETVVTLPPWTSAGVSAMTVQTSGDHGWTVAVSDGSSQGMRTFLLEPRVKEWNYFPSAWGIQPRRITLTPGTGSFHIEVRAYGARADLPADPATLLAWPRELWRSPQREWFQWSGTSVLVLVTGDYAIQDAYLKRLAFFVEKTGYRGRLVTDAEVSHLHGWNAHDYAAPDLARFFSLAAEQKFPLDAAERELLDRVVGAGIIKPAGNRWEAGTGALVGISADSAPALRHVLFVHEAFHGLYYTSPEFRAAVKAAWDAMRDDSRAAFRASLARFRYDPSDEALMINEFQAYVLQRRAADWPSYFEERVLADMPPAQETVVLADLIAAARAVDQKVFELYGLHAGSVSLLSTTAP